MNTTVRNVSAVVLGFVAGSVVNMAIVQGGPMLIPLPPGVDLSTAEGMAAGIARFEPRHFVSPLLAHALGTFVGALVAWFVAGSRKDLFAWVVGVLFLCGGIAACFMIPAPVWFMALDLVVAYLPMAWLAIWVARRIARDRA